MKIKTVAAACLLVLCPFAHASVFSCTSGGKTVYTSEPSGACADARLPKIGSHQGGEYRLRVDKLNKQTKETAAKKKKAKKETAKKKNTAKKSKRDKQEKQ